MYNNNNYTTDKYKKYSCSYEFKNQKWGIEISALSLEEAKARLKAIGTIGKIDGEIKLNIPIPKII